MMSSPPASNPQTGSSSNSAMPTVRWGVIGPGNIAGKFVTSVHDVEAAVVTGVASANADKSQGFIDHHKLQTATAYASYQQLFESDAVDAIYIANLHPWHAQTAIDAMRHGKHVLCEKPASMHAAQLLTMTEVATQENVLFMEAFMYLCHPQMAELEKLLAGGEIGEVSHIRANFGFNAPIDDQSRLFAHALGGGGILDVGCYPVSFARRVAGMLSGNRFENPKRVHGVGKLHKTKVDLSAFALLQFPSGLTAECACAVTQNMDNEAVVIGSKGHIKLLHPWLPGNGNKPADALIEVVTDKGSRSIDVPCAVHHYAGQLEIACLAINASTSASTNVSINQAELQNNSALSTVAIEAAYPAMNYADSLGNAEVLDQWRAQLGYKGEQDLPTKNKPLSAVLPGNLPVVPSMPIAGLEQTVSRLILGCDHHQHIANGSIVWDAWMDAGGNAFDTAFIYGDGSNERAFGHWIKNRGVAKDIVVVVKGAHSPYCFPEVIGNQLDMSLARLNLDTAPIYIMHRDNTNVPVGEFVDSINALQQAGKIGVYGMSNWSLARYFEAVKYAETHGLNPPSILNNNCSLATMTVPVWEGCISVNNESSFKLLEENNVTLFSWSAQARGFFLPESMRQRLPLQVGPDHCFSGDENIERRKRAALLATERGVSTSNIALAWVLSFKFPTAALIGPRSAGEIASLLPALSVQLSEQESQWLNLAINEKPGS